MWNYIYQKRKYRLRKIKEAVRKPIYNQKCLWKMTHIFEEVHIEVNTPLIHQQSFKSLSSLSKFVWIPIETQLFFTPFYKDSYSLRILESYSRSPSSCKQENHISFLDIQMTQKVNLLGLQFPHILLLFHLLLNAHNRFLTSKESVLSFFKSNSPWTNQNNLSSNGKWESYPVFMFPLFVYSFFK